VIDELRVRRYTSPVIVGGRNGTAAETVPIFAPAGHASALSCASEQSAGIAPIAGKSNPVPAGRSTTMFLTSAGVSGVIAAALVTVVGLKVWPNVAEIPVLAPAVRTLGVNDEVGLKLSAAQFVAVKLSVFTWETPA
jgi:hypothetical protein